MWITFCYLSQAIIRELIVGNEADKTQTDTDVGCWCSRQQLYSLCCNLIPRLGCFERRCLMLLLLWFLYGAKLCYVKLKFTLCAQESY